MQQMKWMQTHYLPNKLQRSWHFLCRHLLLHLNVKKHNTLKAGQHLTGKSCIRQSDSSILKSIHSIWHTAKEKHNSSLKEALSSTAEWIWKWPPLYLQMSMMHVLTHTLLLQSDCNLVWNCVVKKSKAQEHVPSHSWIVANSLLLNFQWTSKVVWKCCDLVLRY